MVVFVAFAGIAGGGVAGSIGLVIVMLLGGVGLIVALLYASARLALAIPACVLERLGPVDAIRRSLALTQGSALRLALAIILTATVYYLFLAVFSIPYVFAMIRMFSTKNFAGLTPYPVFQYLGAFIASSFASPLAAIAATLMYYDERVRKEAFDLQWMMVLMGGQSQPPAQPQPPAQEPPPPEGSAVTPPALGSKSPDQIPPGIKRNSRHRRLPGLLGSAGVIAERLPGAISAAARPTPETPSSSAWRS